MRAKNRRAAPSLLTLRLFVLFSFCASIRHYFPKLGQSAKTAVGFTAPRDFHPRQDLCRPPPLRDPAFAGLWLDGCVAPALSWRYGLPQAVFRSDGNRSAPYLAVFDGGYPPQVVFAHPPLSLVPFGNTPANVFLPLDIQFSKDTRGR